MAGKFCTSCGEPLTGRTKFCTSCGSPVAMPADAVETADRVSVTAQQSDQSTVVTAPIPTLSRSKPAGVSRGVLFAVAVGVALLTFGAVGWWMSHGGEAPQAATAPVASASPSASPSVARAAPTEAASAPSAVPSASRPAPQASTPEAGGQEPPADLLNSLEVGGLYWVQAVDRDNNNKPIDGLYMSNKTSDRFAAAVQSEVVNGGSNSGFYYQEGSDVYSPETKKSYRMSCTNHESGYVYCQEVDSDEGSALDAAVAWRATLDYD